MEGAAQIGVLAPPAVDTEYRDHKKGVCRSWFAQQGSGFAFGFFNQNIDLAELLGYFGTKFYELWVHVGAKVSESGVYVSA